MSVRIYPVTSKTYEALAIPESYVFRRKAAELRLDAVADIDCLKFGIEYTPCVGARQNNFVAVPPFTLSSDFRDVSGRGCRRYLRNVAACLDILEEGSLLFAQSFPESRVPLESIIGMFAYELMRYN